ncbi:MAG: DNA-processing protein DprA [Candidatus Omnitrophica bacterium]|nr:DNA-processing protein DprA [Candidatus Omnitrophota bacterium]
MRGLLKISDPRYPRLLKEIKSAPKEIFYKGTWDKKTFKNCLAVVGSRRMTSYGRQVAEKLVSAAAVNGLTIISGFMYGIDAAAHRAALDAGGRTIAVMPCGIDLIHPYYQTNLYKRILDEKGLIISEYGGKSQPTLWTYPQRNRIVAGLCQAALVVEAGEKSGSLITAALARKYKRKVFAVPGPISSPVSQGTIQLIKEGAEIVKGPEDLLDFYGVKKNIFFNRSLSLSQDSALEKKIRDKLLNEPLEIDILARVLNLSVEKISTTISLMQVKGVLFKENGKYYIKDSC